MAESTLRELADLVGGRVLGDPDLRVRDLVPLAEAGEGELGLLADARYLDRLEGSGATALLVAERLVPRIPGWAGVAVEEPHGALPAILQRLYPARERAPGIHPTAVLGRGVRLGRDVSLAPYVVVGDGATLGDRVMLAAHVVVGEGVAIGCDSVLHPHVVVYPGAVIGERVVLHSGVRVGVDGFGYVPSAGGHRKVPQVGGCRIDDDVEIGANSAVDRGSIGRTVIGAGSKVDNLVHVAHNVRVGRGALLLAQSGIAGSTTLEDGVILGGQAAVSGHLSVGTGARIGGKAGVIGDMPAGETWSGFPARPHRDFLRASAALHRMVGLQRDFEARISALEARLREAGGADGQGAGTPAATGSTPTDPMLD